MTKFLITLNCDGGCSITSWRTARLGDAMLAEILLSAIRTHTDTLTDGMFKGSLANTLSIDSWL